MELIPILLMSRKNPLPPIRDRREDVANLDYTLGKVGHRSSWRGKPVRYSTPSDLGEETRSEDRNKFPTSTE